MESEYVGSRLGGGEYANATTAPRGLGQSAEPRLIALQGRLQNGLDRLRDANGRAANFIERTTPSRVNQAGCETDKRIEPYGLLEQLDSLADAILVAGDDAIQNAIALDRIA